MRKGNQYIKEPEKQDSLGALVDEYVEIKALADKYSKQAEPLNKKIKSIMIDSELDEAEGDIGSVRMTTRTSESFDEEKLIDYLKQSGFARGIVRKKEYIDYDALESAIYHEKIAGEDLKRLNQYKITKQTKVLNIVR